MSQGAGLISILNFLLLLRTKLEFVHNRNRDGFSLWDVLKWNRIHYKISNKNILAIVIIKEH